MISFTKKVTKNCGKAYMISGAKKWAFLHI